MRYSNDPPLDFQNLDWEENQRISSLPICVDCGEHIQDEVAYNLGKGLVCPACLKERKVCLA